MTEENKNETITLMFSEIAANYVGSSVAEIPDGKGGRKEVEFTQICNPDNYKWADKEERWAGVNSECKWLREGREGNMKLPTKTI